VLVLQLPVLLHHGGVLREVRHGLDCPA
jgi:hypothetical protein